MKKRWYALQETTEDDWGTGADTLEEAIEMAKQLEWPTLIAVIENDVCVDELRNGIEIEW